MKSVNDQIGGIHWNEPQTGKKKILFFFYFLLVQTINFVIKEFELHPSAIMVNKILGISDQNGEWNQEKMKADLVQANKNYAKNCSRRMNDCTKIVKSRSESK